MRVSSFFAMAAVFLCASCARPAPPGKDTIEFVKNIASNTESPEYQLLNGFSKIPVYGNVCIIGPEESNAKLCADFIGCDLFENARGRKWSDGLRDFAGEFFSCMDDATFTPYGKYAEELGTQALREAGVRLALAALSDRCSVSMYDPDGNRSKTPGKAIILSDPWLRQYGKFDIDTLFALTSCAVPVISPQDLMFDAVFAGGQKRLNIGLLCDSCNLVSGIYGEIYAEKIAEHGISGSHLFQAADNAGDFSLSAFLDAYLDSGGSAPLEALLVDCLSPDLAAMNAELEAMRDFSREEYMRYGKLVSPSFVILDSSVLTREYCYALLREKNLFTHRIAQPVFDKYEVIPYKGDGPAFLLIPSGNVQNQF